MTKNYSADFETITTAPTRVWLWGICEIGNEENIQTGTHISDFYNLITSPKYNKSTIYFHNLKFDGFFLVWHLLVTLKIPHSNDKKILTRFDTMIGGMGQWYQITIYNNKHKVTIRDSLKKIPLSVKEIPKAFGLEESKGEIDYHKYREIDYVPNDEEIDYLLKDIIIVSKSLKQQFDKGLKKMTVGADALNKYKELNVKFNDFFPTLEAHIDSYIRKSYKGGYVKVKNEIQSETIIGGKVYDVNSMYPWAMTQKMPYGLPIYTTSEKDLKDKRYPLYVCRILADFKVKDGYTPTIQIKGSDKFFARDYVEDSRGKEELTLTNIDYELFLKHYEIYEYEFLDAYLFKGAYGMFDEYIHYWSNIKSNHTGGMRTIAKLMLNSLYGKFAKKPKITSKVPKYDEDDNCIKLINGETENTETVYIPVGCFVTAYARQNLINTIQNCYDRFLYCDTDSIHIQGFKTPNINIHETKLGAWKEELKFVRARYIQPKTYIEEVVNKEMNGYDLKITASGMPTSCYKYVTFDNYKIGSIYPNKLKQKRVEGGVILINEYHTLGGK